MAVPSSHGTGAKLPRNQSPQGATSTRAVKPLGTRQASLPNIFPEDPVMRAIKFVLVLSAAMFIPATAISADAQSILDKARKMQEERWEGVDLYMIDQSINGHRTQTYMMRVNVTDKSGSTQPVFVPMSANQVLNNQGKNTQTMTPEQLEEFAAAQESVGAAMSAEIEHGLGQAGLPAGMLSATGSDPWNTMDPGTMMRGGATFMRGAAEGERERLSDTGPDAQAMADEWSQFREKAQLVETVRIGGRKAYHLRATGIDNVQYVDGDEMRFDTMAIWIDTKDYVPLRMTMSGTMTAEGQTRPMTIERDISDYRNVPNSKMYESYRSSMRLGGMLSAEHEAEMAKAAEEMADFEQELANMSAEERAMVEQMMGPQLETMRQMASGGGFQLQTVVHAIAINPDVTAQNVTSLGMAGPATAPAAEPAAAPAHAAAGDSLLMVVQQDLATLGYQPGNTDGVASTETAIAISKFQAERGLEVTGEASPQLAGILSAEVDRAQAGGVAPVPRGYTTRSPAELEAAQQACLQQKIAETQASQKKRRGLGRLMSAVTRTALRQGNYDLARTASDVYSASATADDLAAAAKDLGLTEDEVEACRNPQ